MIGIPSSKEKVLQNDDSFNKIWFRFFEDIYRAIRLDTDIKIGGNLNVDSSSASNSGTSQTDLLDYTIKANSLTNNGDVLEIEAWGVYAANANNKTVTLEFGSQTILDTGSISANDGSWHIKATIIRKSTNTQEIIANIISSNSSVSDSSIRTSGSQDLSDDIQIKCTATGGASNDVTQYALIIKLNPNS